MSETLRDYLVTLGFKVNKADEARFKDALGTAAKTVAGLTAAMTAAAAAIQASVIKIAADFDSIYFASQRTGTSVANIKSLSYALSQVGGSSGQAASAIEGLAAAIRTNPGIEGMLNSLGIATRENGRLKDTADIIDGIVSNLSKSHPYYTSAQIAGILGIDEATFRVLVTQWPQIKKFQDDYKRRAAEFGVDPDKVAQSSNKLMTSFRDLLLSLQLVTEKVTVELQPVLTKYLGEFAKWVQAHSDDIVKAVLGIVEAVNGMARDFALFLDKIEPVTDAFLDLVTSLTGDGGLKWALEAVLLFMARDWLAGMLAVLATLMRNPAFLALAAIMGIGYDVFVMSDQEKLDVGGNVNDAVNGKAGDPPNWWTRQQNKAREFLGMPPVDNKGKPASPADSKDAAKPGKSDGGLNPEIKSRFDKMMDEAPEKVRKSVKVNSGYRSIERQKQLFDEAVKKYGSEDAARKYVAPPGRSQHNFGEAMDLDFGSLAAQEYIHRNAEKYGLKFPLPHEPWHIERIDGRDSSGTPIRTPDSSGAPDKRSEIKGIGDEILKSINQASLQPFDAGAFALGNSVTRSTSIEQNTKIEINGSSDPASTSNTLGALQPRLNAELLRNSQSAFA